jgi:flagellar basal-body rod modification protein FlgD
MAITSLTSPSTTQTAANTASSSNGLALSQSDFMNLLVTQMQNQNPLQPVSTTDFITQLAQFSQVSSMQGVTSNLTQMLSLQQITQGSNLIGKQVTFAVAGKTTPSSGVVSAVQVNNGTVNLLVGSQSVPLTQVTAVQSAS